MTRRIVAIDGPAASGKSSTAAAVAAHLGLRHVDSGALYRAMTWLALRHRLTDAAAIVSAADAAEVVLSPIDHGFVVLASGNDIENAIRTEEVTAEVSRIAALPEVRDWVNRRLRDALAHAGGGVMDGRDIGTVVFPDAALKVFLTASPEARARRRLLQRGEAVAPGVLRAEAAQLAERDRLDAGRAVAPLRQAEDAIYLDTSEMAFEAQVAQIVRWAAEKGLLPG